MTTPALRWSRLLIVASGCALLAWACGTTSPSSPSSVSGVVSGATGLGSTPTTGTVQGGTAPGATSGGPAASASSGSSATSGGGDEVSVSAGGTPFQTVFVSAGSSGTGAVAVSGLGASSARVETVASGFIQISLPSAVTNLAIGLAYASNLPSTGFDLLIQVANGTSVGPVATVHKVVTTSNFVEVSGIVFATVSQRTAGPGLPVNPVAGAVVSTSLDSNTAKTDAAGGFKLQTGTVAPSGSPCYTITITSPGLPTYSVHGLWGGQVLNQIFVMSPPSPSSIPGSCGSS